MSGDEELLNYLDTFMRDMPHAEFGFNDDPDAEDDDGAPLPVGFWCYVESHDPTFIVVRGSLRELIAAIKKGESD